MASAAALQYPQPAGRFPRTPFSGSALYPSNASSFSSPSLPRTNSGTLPVQPSRSETPDLYFNPGAFAAARSMTDHAKLHKRSSIGSSRTAASQAPSFAQSAPFASSETPQPPKSIAKVRFKTNFKKLTQQKNDTNQGTLDLSKTAEENEKRSGLGIYPSEPSSPSFGPLPFPPAPMDMSIHSRTVSHTSQYSSTSGQFKPSAPFTIPGRSSPGPITPPLASSYSPSMISGAEPYGEGLSNLSHEVTFDNPTDESSSPAPKPFLRVNTSASDSSNRLAYSSSYIHTPPSTVASPSSRSTRPRRSTNQSSDTAATSKSRTSIDRAFSFVARSASGGERDREEPIDPVTRAATIQAARRAFQEKEEAKARKYALREQKAAEKAQRKRDTDRAARFGDARRRRTTSETQSRLVPPRTDSLTATATAAAIASGRAKSPAVFTATTEYSDMARGPSPHKGDRALTGGSREKRKKKTMRGTTVKSRYERFLSWLRTKLLNIGGRRRR